MNESKWLTGTDGDAMLELVSDRLSPRQWLLVCCAYARRLWDFLPAGVLQDAIDFAERAEGPLDAARRAEWQKKLDAAVPFYGIPPENAVDVTRIRAPVLGHFAQHDDWCSPDRVDVLEKKLKGANVPAEIHRYDAQHAFFNDTRSGRLAAQVNENVNGVRDLLSMTLTSIARDAVSLVGLIAVMVIQDPFLSAMSLLIGPPLIYAVAYLMRRLRRATGWGRPLVDLRHGPLAQLVERHVYTVDVVGSIPAGPTVSCRAGPFCADRRRDPRARARPRAEARSPRTPAVPAGSAGASRRSR